LERYWRVDAARDTRLPSDHAYAEAFRDLFVQAVECRLRSAYPVGAMLSGGLDSSSVVGAARPRLAERQQRLHTFSFVFETPDISDEQAYIDLVTAAGGLEQHVIPLDALTPFTWLGEIVAVTGEPFDHPAFSWQWAANAAAQGAGVRVLLDGNGGDRVVSHGNPRLAELVRGGHWLTLGRELRALRRDWPRLSYGLEQLWHHGFKPNIPPAAREARRQLRQLFDRRAPVWARGALIRPDFAWHMHGDPVRRALQAARTPRYRDTRAEGRFNLGQLPPVNELYDHLAAHFQIEVRHPFLDRRLVEFCLGLPGEQRLRAGWPRAIQRQAMAGILPETIRWRRTKGSPAQYTVRALLTAGLPELGQMLRGAGPAAEWIDLEAARRNYAQLCQAAEQGDFTWQRSWVPAYRLTRVASVAAWLKQQPAAALIDGAHVTT
jgi:asparagine synthase (glutamine-hydrolysing)